MHGEDAAGNAGRGTTGQHCGCSWLGNQVRCEPALPLSGLGRCNADAEVPFFLGVSILTPRASCRVHTNMLQLFPVTRPGESASTCPCVLFRTTQIGCRSGLHLRHWQGYAVLLLAAVRRCVPSLRRTAVSAAASWACLRSSPRRRRLGRQRRHARRQKRRCSGGTSTSSPSVVSGRPRLGWNSRLGCNAAGLEHRCWIR